jgi:Icc-related predicted phosphoesterase
MTQAPCSPQAVEIYLWSDVHLDHWKQEHGGPVPGVPSHTTTLPPARPRVLVVAGDICTADKAELGVQWLEKLGSDCYDHVVVVLGNHDYYGLSYEAATLTWERLQPRLRESNVHLLMGAESVILAGVRFVGLTLWSRQAADARVLRRGLADFRFIQGWTPERAECEHWRELNALRDKLMEESSNCPTLVVTHHLPSWQCIDAKYKGGPCNAGFCSDLDGFILEHRERITGWVHGHTHSPVAVEIHGVPVRCNPLGYPDEHARSLSPVCILFPFHHPDDRGS